MAPRKRPSTKAQTIVLTRSARRCALCFGIHGDTSVKSGQIIHIDRNPSNSDDANLAFLCLKHHDEYDSRRSQSKQLTEAELLSYRRKLYEWVDQHVRSESTGDSGLPVRLSLLYGHAIGQYCGEPLPPKMVAVARVTQGSIGPSEAVPGLNLELVNTASEELQLRTPTIDFLPGAQYDAMEFPQYGPMRTHRNLRPGHKTVYGIYGLPAFFAPAIKGLVRGIYVENQLGLRAEVSPSDLTAAQEYYSDHFNTADLCGLFKRFEEWRNGL